MVNQDIVLARRVAFEYQKEELLALGWSLSEAERGALDIVDEMIELGEIA